MEERECKMCHKKLMVYSSSKQKFCSHRCFGISCLKSPKIRVCLYCKKTFTRKTQNQDQKFCSRKCVTNSLDRRITKKCFYCKKDFRPSNTNIRLSGAKFCSRSCSGRWYGKLWEKPHTQKRCPVCKTQFSVRPSSIKKKYCSITCGFIGKYLTPEAKLKHIEAIKNKKLRHKIKEGRRRAETKTTDITAKFLRDLWNRTDVCPLCGLQMEDNTSWPWGRHLDHIIPLHPKDKSIPKGTHTKDNMQYIHSVCNVNKGCQTLQKFSQKKIIEIQERYLHLYHRGSIPHSL